MNILKGNVNINAPAEVVQIALKGLLSYKGVDNPQSYSLDRKAIKTLQKTPEGRNLSGLLINIKTLKFYIVSTSGGTSNLSYEAEPRGYKAPLPIFLFVESGLLFLIGIMAQIITEMLPLAIICYIVGALLIAVTFVFAIPTRNRFEKIIQKLLLPRLDRYIDIINEHIER